MAGGIRLIAALCVGLALAAIASLPFADPVWTHAPRTLLRFFDVRAEPMTVIAMVAIFALVLVAVIAALSPATWLRIGPGSWLARGTETIRRGFDRGPLAAY